MLNRLLQREADINFTILFILLEVRIMTRLQLGSVVIALLVLSSFAFAQLPQEFTQLAKNNESGTVYSAALGPDGTLFLSTSSKGMMAYTFDGTTHTRAATWESGPSRANKTLFASDGTILMAVSNYLYAVTFDGTTFTLKERKLAYARDIALSPNGTIFVAGYNRGIGAYTFDGSAFTEVVAPSIETTGGDTTKEAYSIAAMSDNTVLVADGLEGLKAFSYDGTQFTQLAHIDSSDATNDKLSHVAIGSDGKIFALSTYDGIRCFTFDGASFTHVAKLDVRYPRNMRVHPDGTIFVALSAQVKVLKMEDGAYVDTQTFSPATGAGISDMALSDDDKLILALGELGVQVCNYDATSLAEPLAESGHINDFGSAKDVVAGSDGKVFLANNNTGLLAYDFDGSSLTLMARASDGKPAVGVALGSDGTIFMANGSNLQALTYDGSTFTQTATTTEYGRYEDVVIGEDGTLFVDGGYRGIYAFTFDGSSFTKTAEIDSGHVFDVAPGADGTLFAADRERLQAFTYDGSSFNYITHTDSGSAGYNYPLSVEVGDDGTIFTANYGDGLRAFTFDGTSFTQTAHTTEQYVYYNDVALGPDGTVFTAQGGRGMAAFTYDGSEFTQTANLGNGFNIKGLHVGPDGNIFATCDSQGLLVFAYSKYTTGVSSSGSALPHKFTLLQNYPNPFNPTTRIAYSLLDNADVTLRVYNLNGQLVNTLVDKNQIAGSYDVEWNGTDNRGMKVSSGVYLYELKSNGNMMHKKMIMLK